MDARARLCALVKRHSGVDVSSDLFAEAGLDQVVATMEFLADMAAAGNKLAVALDKAEQVGVEDAICGYIGDCGRAVNQRTAKLGVQIVREGCRRFEVG